MDEEGFLFITVWPTSVCVHRSNTVEVYTAASSPFHDADTKQLHVKALVSSQIFSQHYYFMKIEAAFNDKNVSGGPFRHAL